MGLEFKSTSSEKSKLVAAFQMCQDCPSGLFLSIHDPESPQIIFASVKDYFYP